LLTLNDGTTIKARKVLAGKLAEVSMRDPFEPEKGPDKAKVFESIDHTKRPAMHSFVHGGQMYYFHCDLDSLPYLIDKMEDEDVFTIVRRDFKGYMLDKAITVLMEHMDRTRGAIKKRLKEVDHSKVTDIVVTDEGFSENENIATEHEAALKQLDDTFVYA